MKTTPKQPFKVGDYVQVANLNCGFINRITADGKTFEVEPFFGKLIHSKKTNLSPISFNKMQINLKFFAELEKRNLPIPRSEIYLYNPFFEASPVFNKKTGKKVIPKNAPKRHDYFFDSKKVSIEIDGGTFGRISGHNSGIGIRKGMDKTNWCAHYGIALYRFTPEDLLTELTFKFLTHKLK